MLQSKAMKKRKLSYPEEGTEVSERVLNYTLDDFPEEDVVDAPEVSAHTNGVLVCLGMRNHTLGPVGVRTTIVAGQKLCLIRF